MFLDGVVAEIATEAERVVGFRVLIGYSLGR